MLDIVLGTILEVTEIVPVPPLIINSVAVGSSPEYKAKLSFCSESKLVTKFSKRPRSPVASFRPTIF